MNHAVIAYLRLSDAEFGGPNERNALFELEDALIDAIEKALVGELDGHEFGQGECIFYMYGEDADALFKAVEPVLRSSKLARGGYLIKRYGPAEDQLAKEVRINL